MPSIASFVASIGVNTHVDSTGSAYGNVALVQTSLEYIGISFIRDHAYGTQTNLAAYTALANAGIGLDLILDDDPKAEIDSLITLAAAIRVYEGPNEVDFQPVVRDGVEVDAVTEQQSVQTAIRETAAVSTVPLIAESVADPNNLPTYAGNLAYSDFGNLHAYAVQGQSPRTVLADDLAIARSLPPSQPIAVTETGYFTIPSDPNGVDETVQAKLTLDTLFDSSSLGISLTFLYELYDEPDPNNPDAVPSEQHYGLFNADGTPKLAATALHNLNSILAAANTTPGTAPALSLSTSNLPDTGHTLVLTGDAGTTVVAIWAEPQIWDSKAHAEITVPITMTTLDFGTLAATAIVLDPLTGTSPIARYTNVSSITVGLTDHPLLIAISAPTVTPITPTPVDPTPPPPTPVPPISTPPISTPPISTPPISTPGTTTPLDRTIGVYRFFDKSNGTYFYTASASEAQTVRQTRPDLVAEGAGGIGLVAIAPASNDPLRCPGLPLFRPQIRHPLLHCQRFRTRHHHPHPPRPLLRTQQRILRAHHLPIRRHRRVSLLRHRPRHTFLHRQRDRTGQHRQHPPRPPARRDRLLRAPRQPSLNIPHRQADEIVHARRALQKRQGST